MEGKKKRKKFVKTNKTHFPALCTLIRLYYICFRIHDHPSHLTRSTVIYLIALTPNSSNQVGRKMQFANSPPADRPVSLNSLYLQHNRYSVLFSVYLSVCVLVNRINTNNNNCQLSLVCTSERTHRQ